MDEQVQPRSLKLTIKVKTNKTGNQASAANPLNNLEGDVKPSATHTPCSPKNSPQDQVKSNNTGNHSSATNPLNNLEGDAKPSATPTPSSPKNSSHDQVKMTSPETMGNTNTENDENQAPDNSQYQMVLYDPAANGGQKETEPDPTGGHSPALSRTHVSPNPAPRLFPSVGSYTVQCDHCFKWRLIPTAERYEEIREHIIQNPFTCEKAREWRPNLTCEDAPDIEQDGSRLWAIDKPSIPKPPPGWQRILRIRAEGGSKFADVYYESPSRKRHRSSIEVEKYLAEHKDKYAGISIKQFSFQIPKPLQEDYVRKRPARARTDDANNPAHLLPTQVEPLAWACPNMDMDLERTGLGLFKPEVQAAKKKRPSSSTTEHNGDMSYGQNVVILEDSD